MKWEDVQIGAKMIRDYTGKKLAELTDSAAQRLKLASLEKEINETFAEFGKKTYEYFVSEEDGSDVLTGYVQKLTLLLEEKSRLEERIASKKQKSETPEATVTPEAAETEATAETDKKEEQTAETDII